MSDPLNNPTIDWRATLGPLAEGMQSADIQELDECVLVRSPRSIRLSNGERVDALPFDTVPVPWFSQGRTLADNNVRPGGFLHHSAGAYYVQDAASMLAIALCDVQPGESVLDLCAAPGGKSTAIVNQLAGSGLLVANEVISSRVSTLSSALWRTGYANHLTTNLDAERLAVLMPGAFDCVLVDAPCSGQSMLARGKQSVAAFADHQVAHSAARQVRIMRAALKLVRPGGRLVYSTCTFAYQENEAIVEGMLQEFLACSVRKGRATLEPWRSPLLDGCYRLWPGRDPCAGGFAAVIHVNERSDEVGEPPARLPSAKKRGNSKWQQLSSLPDEVENWYSGFAGGHDPGYKFLRRQDRIQIVTASASDALIELAVAATPIAVQKGNRYEPEYASAIQRNILPEQEVSLDDAAAVAFVAGVPVSMPSGSSGAGWCRVAWRGRPLAWGKLTGLTLKNHMPKHLRQRTQVEAIGGAG